MIIQPEQQPHKHSMVVLTERSVVMDIWGGMKIEMALGKVVAAGSMNTG